MMKLLQRWWQGKYVPPPPNDPNSPVVIFLLGHYDRHWTARAVSAISTYWKDNKVGALLLAALAGAVCTKLVDRLF